jgi:hypothetical protein
LVKQYDRAFRQMEGLDACSTSRTSVVAERQAPLCQLYGAQPHEALTRKTARTSAANIPADDPFHGEVEIGQGYGTLLRFGLDRCVGAPDDRRSAGGATDRARGGGER